MKALIWYGATAIVVSVAAMMSGQSEIPNVSSSSARYIETSKLVGRKVKSVEGKEIGIFKDVVIDRSNGSMAYTVLSTGGGGAGVTSGGGKLVAVPWAVYSPISDLSVLTVNVHWEKIHNAPAFDYARMEEYARPDYTNNVYSYYGVSPGPATAVAAGTDVTGTAGATASPGEVASPAAAPAGTGSPNKKPSAKAIRNTRAIGARPSIDRDETDSSVTTEKPSSESATSPNETKKSRSKAIEGTSTRRPSTTPESAEGQD